MPRLCRRDTRGSKFQTPMEAGITRALAQSLAIAKAPQDVCRSFATAAVEDFSRLHCRQRGEATTQRACTLFSRFEPEHGFVEHLHIRSHYIPFLIFLQIAKRKLATAAARVQEPVSNACVLMGPGWVMKQSLRTGLWCICSTIPERTSGVPCRCWNEPSSRFDASFGEIPMRIWSP